MLLTLDLPEHLVEHLESSAAALDVSVNTLTSRLLMTALDAQANTPRTPAPAVEPHPTDELRALVAEIAALPQDSALIEPATKRLDDAFLQELLAASDEDSISPEEWNRLWTQVEREMDEIDLLDEIAEGRG